MEIMSQIASMSTGLSQMKASQQASVSVMKMAMDQGSETAQELIKAMEMSVQPNLGANIDIGA